jgi:hypothetical protein
MKHVLIVSIRAGCVFSIAVAFMAMERPIEKANAIEDAAMSGDIIDNEMISIDGGTVSSSMLIGDGYVTLGSIKPPRWIYVGGVVTIDTYEKRATYNGAPDEAAKKFVKAVDEYISGSWGFNRILRSGSDTMDRAYLLYVGDEYNSEDLSIEALPKKGLTVGGLRVLEWGDSDNPELRTVCDVEKGVAAFRKVLEKYK